MPHIQHLLSDLFGERGQTMTETAVILALIVLIAMVGVAIFSTSLTNLWAHLASALPLGG